MTASARALRGQRNESASLPQRHTPKGRRFATQLHPHRFRNAGNHARAGKLRVAGFFFGRPHSHLATPTGKLASCSVRPGADGQADQYNRMVVGHCGRRILGRRALLCGLEQPPIRDSHRMTACMVGVVLSVFFCNSEEAGVEGLTAASAVLRERQARKEFLYPHRLRTSFPNVCKRVRLWADMLSKAGGLAN